MGEDLDMGLFDFEDFKDLETEIETVDGGTPPEETDPKDPPGDDPKDPPGETPGETQEDIDKKNLGEDEDPEKVGKDAEEEDDPDDSGDTSPELYKAFATVLQEKGVLTSADSSLDNIKDVDTFVELIKKEISSHELKDLNDTQKKALEAYREGVSVKVYDEQIKLEDKLNNIQEDAINEDEELRRNLIFQEYKSRNYSDAQAEKLTKRSFDLDEDVEDAKNALESLKETVKVNFEKEREELTARQEKQKADAAKEQEQLKKKIFSTNEIIEGYDIPEVVKKKVYEDMTTPVSINPITNKEENVLMKFQRENPQEFSHKLYYLFSVTKGFSDFSYFTNKERSNSVNNLEKAIKQSTFVKGGGDPSFIEDVNSNSLDIGDELIID